ncbi:hypothetical protein BDP_1877 [Bifidobacterium dentium Bd1]|uniref:Uncharacterized protein n=1 Tax=Bifidobacterium dentium (strain ATCC 27534 / DSM 20436 / JCM 1195 / Bd1) TaxID=401473 RepID=D2Q694_BIFDB|nr:hypothetical protein BDP_1877 [Bifidobacterium dentium Bd1]
MQGIITNTLNGRIQDSVYRAKGATDEARKRKS